MNHFAARTNAYLDWLDADSKATTYPAYIAVLREQMEAAKAVAIATEDATLGYSWLTPVPDALVAQLDADVEAYFQQARKYHAACDRLEELGADAWAAWQAYQRANVACDLATISPAFIPA